MRHKLKLNFKDFVTTLIFPSATVTLGLLCQFHWKYTRHKLLTLLFHVLVVTSED